MKNKTRISLERFKNLKNQYRLVAEGIGVGILTGLLVSLFRMRSEERRVGKEC